MMKYILSKSKEYSPSVVTFNPETEEADYPESCWIGYANTYLIKKGDTVKDSDDNTLTALDDGILFTFYKDSKYSATIVYDKNMIENVLYRREKNANKEIVSCNGDACELCR